MKSKTMPSATSSATTPNEISVALMVPPRLPLARLRCPPRGRDPAWERPGAGSCADRDARARSRVLEDDALDEVGDILAAVGDRFEQLVDRLQLDQLAHILFFAEQARHRRAHDAVGVGLEAIDLLAGLDRRFGDARLADLRQQRHGVLDALAAFGADVAQTQDVVVHRLHVVQRHRLAGVLQEVEDVVHGVDEAVDLLAVDRSDEGLVQEAVDLRSDLVGLSLGRADLDRVALAKLRVGVVLDQANESARAFGDVAAVLVEELEEIPFAWKQLAEQHSSLLVAWRVYGPHRVRPAGAGAHRSQSRAPPRPTRRDRTPLFASRHARAQRRARDTTAGQRARMPARRAHPHPRPDLRRPSRPDRLAARRQRPGQDNLAAHPGRIDGARGGRDPLGRCVVAAALSLPRPCERPERRPDRDRIAALPAPAVRIDGRARRSRPGARRGARPLRSRIASPRTGANPLARPAPACRAGLARCPPDGRHLAARRALRCARRRRRRHAECAARRACGGRWQRRPHQPRAAGDRRARPLRRDARVHRRRMTRLFTALVARDLRLAGRRRSDALLPIAFFTVAVSLFPLGVGPEAQTLRLIAPGVVWVAALLAAMISVTQLYATDLADGSLEQMLLASSPGLAIGLVAAKAAAHWLVTGLPLVVAAPVFGLMFDMRGEAIATLTITLLLGTPILSLLGGLARR